ncbi:MAG: hypothetical protein HOD60_12930, partial [Candidatus Nitrosopelagicus sp.]|nr:hypothetical protein [Candidatus Nitrosopelagicus sp.]
MKPIVIIAIAFVFLFVPTSILAQESLTTYENDEYGFMIDYPIHWTVDKLIFDLPSVIGSSDGGKSIVGFNDEEAGVFVEIMFLKNEDIAQNFEGDDYVNQRKIESKLFCNQSTLSSGFDYTCSDYELKSSSHDDDVYTMTESMIHQYSNGDIKKMIHFQQEIIKNDYVWMLRLDSSEETFDEIYPTIMNMYNSFTLVDSNHNLHEYEIPGWVKNNIKLFGEDKISDSQFFESLEYLIEQGIVPLPFDARNVESTDIPIPEWIKNNARW